MLQKRKKEKKRINIPVGGAEMISEEHTKYALYAHTHRTPHIRKTEQERNIVEYTIWMHKHP